MKSSVKIILIVLIAVLLLAAAAFLLLRHYSKNNIMDGDGMINEAYLTGFRISKGGGMDGGHHETEIRLTEDGASAQISVEDQEYWNAEAQKRTATVDASVLEQIDAIIRESKMAAWESCPASDMIALDAATTSVTISYAAGSFSFSSSQELPDGAWAKVREIESLLRACTEK